MREGFIDTLSPAPRDIWRRMLVSDPLSEISQTPEWLDAMCEVGGFQDSTRLYDLGAGRALLLLLAERRSTPRFLSPGGAWPAGWGIGGALVSGGEYSADEVGLVFRELAARASARTHLAPPPSRSALWAAAAPASAYPIHQLMQRVDLRGGWDEVWKHRFESSARQAFRKAERSDIDVETDSTGRLIPAYYDLYEKSVQRWAQHQREPIPLAKLRQRRRDPLSKLQAIARALGNRCTVWLARVGGEPAAAIIILRHGTIAKYWRGAMDRELANPTRANNLLHGLAVKQACDDGFLWYDMGDSVPGSSLVRFKQTLGAVELPYTSYWIERLPVSRTEAAARDTVKRVLGWREAY